MTVRTMSSRTAAALRDLDPAATTTLTAEERRRADATFARILATPVHEQVRGRADQSRRGRGLVLLGGLLGAGAVAVAAAAALGGGSAFASWTATPAPLPSATAAAAEATCRSALALGDSSARLVLGERRGGWTYVLLEGPGEEAACLMPDHLVGASDVAVRGSGLFGSYDPETPAPPVPQRDGIIETGSTGGAVSVPGLLGLRTTEGWFSWVTGHAGRDVIGVTVHPPVGPAVEASLDSGRFSAWWPAGEARGDNPGVGGAWTYTVTLADGTTRPVGAPR